MTADTTRRMTPVAKVAAILHAITDPCTETQVVHRTGMSPTTTVHLLLVEMRHRGWIRQDDWNRRWHRTDNAPGGAR